MGNHVGRPPPSLSPSSFISSQPIPLFCSDGEKEKCVNLHWGPCLTLPPRPVQLSAPPPPRAEQKWMDERMNERIHESMPLLVGDSAGSSPTARHRRNEKFTYCHRQTSGEWSLAFPQLMKYNFTKGPGASSGTPQSSQPRWLCFHPCLLDLNVVSSGDCCALAEESNSKMFFVLYQDYPLI